jgi:hypothetical protein
MTSTPIYIDATDPEGWGEPHPISGTMLVHGRRDHFELEVVWQLLITSYRDALGHHRTAAVTP